MNTETETVQAKEPPLLISALRVRQISLVLQVLAAEISLSRTLGKTPSHIRVLLLTIEMQR